MQQYRRLALSSVLGVMVLTGCGGSSSGTLTGSTKFGQNYAVIGAISGDYSASSISLVDDLSRLDIVNGYAATDKI